MFFPALVQAWRARRQPGETRAALPVPGGRLNEEEAPDFESDRGNTCGWFNSSHELQQGLQVQEHDAEALAAELPLAPWLEFHLCGWRPAAPG